MAELLKDQRVDALGEDPDSTVAKEEVREAGVRRAEPADLQSRVRGTRRILLTVCITRWRPHAHAGTHAHAGATTRWRPPEAHFPHARAPDGDSQRAPIDRRAGVAQSRPRARHPSEVIATFRDSLLAHEDRVGEAVLDVLVADVAVKKQHAVVVRVDGGFHVVMAPCVAADGKRFLVVTVAL